MKNLFLFTLVACGLLVYSPQVAAQSIGLSSQETSNSSGQPTVTGLPVDTDQIQLDSITTDVVQFDDVIIQGSLAVGFDAVDGEVFDFYTVKLKENNTRLRFEDTSGSASFPSLDWDLEANSSENGGANYFAIVNVDSMATPFQINGEAIDSALVLNSSLELGVNLQLMELNTGVTFSDGTSIQSTDDFNTQIDSLAGVLLALEDSLTNLINSLATVATTGAFSDLTGTSGLQGASAYDIWLDNGNTGTEAEFLTSLQGAQGAAGAPGTAGTAGADGADGASAYDLWLNQGNTGTEADFLSSLVVQGLPAMTGGLDDAGSMTYFDGTSWQTVKPSAAFGNKNVPFKMCNGVPTWGPCGTVNGNRIDMDD